MKDKAIKFTVVKSKKGYSFSSKNGIDLFPDTDEGRKEVIQYLLDRLLNAEVEDGTQYKQVQ